jgi:hypothetical protein
MTDAPGRVVGVKHQDVIAEARKRRERSIAYHSENRNRYKDAISFVGGKQWDEQLRIAREANRRPCLTMDRLGTHINQVVNDQRQSKPAIKVHPVDDQADVKTAEIYNGVIRNIEHLSNAPAVYETASYTQVAGGVGYWRIVTEYCDENAFEQDILLRRILDPLTVLFPPGTECTEQDGSDARYVFIETTMNRDEFEAQYPGQSADWSSTQDSGGWWDGDTVRLAEYFRVVNKPTTLYLLRDGQVKDEAELAEMGIPPEAAVDKRKTTRREVQWFKLGGNSVLDSRVWPGKYIPIVRVVGNELVVDGKITYTGLTHRAMDAQRLYNYQVSTVVEMLSLQKTAPYIGAKGQFKGQEQKWGQANVNNPAYLEYEPVDINGTLAPPPQRQAAPQVPTGNVQAMESAAMDLQWITGQHAANFGAKSNETSGRAINARKAEGDTATYHYIDNRDRGILHTGRIIVDLVPKIYDTKRVLRILGEDETAQIVMQDPDQPEAMRQVQDASGAIQRIYNLGVGRYDVATSVGPSFGTLRQEATEAMTQILQGNPNLWQAIGDLYVRGQNWPYADKIADRLAKMVPPEIKGEEEGNQAEAMVGQMQQGLQMAEQALAERDQALQQASQMLQQLQQDVAQKEQELLSMRTDVETKVASEQIKAEAQKYVADRNAEIEALRTQQQAMQAERDSLADQLAQLAAKVAQLEQREPEEPETPEPEDELERASVQLLAQIAEGQQRTADAVMAAINQRNPMTVKVQRDQNGNAVYEVN